MVKVASAAEGKRGGRGKKAAALADPAPPSRADGSAQRMAVKTLVKPVSNAINILRFLSTLSQPATTTQIARQLGINTSTCFNILRTLASEGVIDFDPVSKAYLIGLELGKLAGNALQQGQRLAATRPLLHEMAESFGVTIALWRRIGTDRMILALLERSSGPLSISMREGLRLPVLLGASGRVAATQLGLSKRDVQKEFKALRWAKAPSFESYWAEAERAAEAGWATDRGNFAAGIQTVAAAVHAPNGEIGFLVVAFVFLDQFEAARISEIGGRLKKLGSRLSEIIY